VFFTLDQIIPNDYARAVIVFGVLVIAFRLILSLGEKILVKFTIKTKTDLDDIILKKTSRPLTLVALLLSFRIALGELTFDPALGLNIAKAIYSGLVVVIGYLVYTIIDVALIRAWRNVAKRTKIEVDESLTHLVTGAIRVILIILAMLYILDLWGVKVLPLIGALGIAGLAVALALQPTLSNIFAGVSMIMDKSVKVGDWIVLQDGTWGVVDKIGIRSTKVKSFDNEMIIVPNSKMADSQIRNVSLPEPMARAVIPFGVAYGANIEKVKKVVIKELLKIKNVVKDDPKPNVRFLEMGDSSLNFKAYIYVKSFDVRMGAIDEANTRIYNILNKEGIEIPFPQMDVHLKEEKKKK